MNRQDFYLNLALELNKLKVPPELINTHIDQFKQYLQTLSEEDAERQIASFGSVGDLAANIYRLLCGSDELPQTQEEPEKAEQDIYDAFRVEQDEELTTAPIPPEPIIPDPVVEPEIFIEPEPVIEPVVETQEEPTEDDGIMLDFDIYDTGAYVAPDLSAFEPTEPPAPEVQPPVHAVPERKKPQPEVQEDDEDEYLDDPIEHHIFTENNSALFWVLFVITLPITLPLFILSMAVFGFVYVIIAALIVVTFVSIFACAVTGTLLALTGGLYGATHMANTAIGLFELGLALVIGGITILLSFFLSVLSVRLLPRLFKHLTTFLRFFLDKLLTLIEKIKKECAHK